MYVTLYQTKLKYMTTIIFIVSLFTLCTLVGSKVFAIKVKEIDFLVSTFNNGDKMIHSWIELAHFKYNRYKKIGRIFIFEFLPSYIYELIVKTKDFVAKKYYSAGDEFRGRRILRSNGSVSFFLERLAEDKTTTSENKI